MALKRCNKCHRTRALSAFGRDSQKPDGLRYDCKECCNKARMVRKVAGGHIPRPIYVDTPTERECRGCRRVIPTVSFGAHGSQCKECMRARSAQYRAQYPDRVADSFSRWYKKSDPAYWVEKVGRRRALMIENGSYKVSKKDLLALMARQAGVCNVCLNRLGSVTHLDHIVPISRGGHHSIGNLQYLCATCNLKKGDKVMMELRVREVVK